jgi:hypothetical protein
MRSTIRTSILCLLMLLLPLQGMASAAGLRAMGPCPMMAAAAMAHADGDGHHGMSSVHGLEAGHTGHAQTKAPCDMGMNCPALGAIGMVSTAPLFPATHGGASLHAATEPHYTSHMPEGLQRPPRLSA